MPYSFWKHCIRYLLLCSSPLFRECYAPDVLESLLGIVQLANYLMPEGTEMDEDKLLDVYCKHRVNMFGIWGDVGECLGYGVYPRGAHVALTSRHVDPLST